MNETILELQQARKIRANFIRQQRAELRALWAEHNAPSNPVLFSRLLRETIRVQYGDYPAPIKPTARNLRRAALSELRYARSYWCNPYDSEYYSACGYDDLQAERRSEARRWGTALAATYFDLKRAGRQHAA